MSDNIPEEIRSLNNERFLSRKKGDYIEADRFRKQIENLGYIVTDTDDGSILRPLQTNNPETHNIRRPGLFVIFGSGEISSSGRRVHEYLVRSFPSPVKIALLETPAGYEDNPHHWYRKLEKFLETGLANYHPEITRIAAINNDVHGGTNDAETISPLKKADYIHLGAGSPSYAVRHLKNSLALETIINRQKDGTSVSVASAAAIAFGRYALPVYEIYFAGHDPSWISGLDFYAEFGLNISIIPHWNNREGGADIDTRFSYMGEKRFQKLLSVIPGPTTIIGIDEHTSLVFDFVKETATVMGLGNITLLGSAKTEIFRNKEIITFAQIRNICYFPVTK
jgi:hypothetical protein